MGADVALPARSTNSTQTSRLATLPWALPVLATTIYFTAIRNAPPVEVSLIAYLWPLFLVVFGIFAWRKLSATTFWALHWE
jgi:drug/metabolite transporter (DMT)-like permease